MLQEKNWRESLNLANNFLILFSTILRLLCCTEVCISAGKFNLIITNFSRISKESIQTEPMIRYFKINLPFTVYYVTLHYLFELETLI